MLQRNRGASLQGARHISHPPLRQHYAVVHSMSEDAVSTKGRALALTNQARMDKRRSRFPKWQPSRAQSLHPKNPFGSSLSIVWATKLGFLKANPRSKPSNALEYLHVSSSRWAMLHTSASK